MKHQKIDPASRVWIVFRGPDGRLHEQIDPAFLENLDPAESEDISDALIEAAGAIEIAHSRLW
jgi:hypothetical protein